MTALRKAAKPEFVALPNIGRIVWILACRLFSTGKH